MINAFLENGRLEIDNTIYQMGIYHINGKLTFVKCEEYIERYHKQTIQQREDAIKFIEELTRSLDQV
jgi:MFS superfamily sulfate permease-like transporter